MREKILKIIEDFYGYEVTEETGFIEVVFDDIGFIELIMDLEMRFNCTIDNLQRSVFDFYTIKEFIDWVEPFCKN